MMNELMSLFANLTPGQQVDTLKFTANAVGKMFLTIGKVFGYFYEPTHIKQLGDAEAYKRKQLADAKAYEIQRIGEAIEQNKFLPLIYRNEDSSITVDMSDTEQLLERSNLRLQQLQIRKEYNIESIIAKATFELEGKEADINDEVDEDWIKRFFSTAEDISDEQVQTLWARILAGEVLKPRTYSYRFLSTLRNISKNELDIVQKIAPFICEDAIIKDFDNLKLKGISKKDVSILEDMGLLKDTSLQVRGTKIAFGENHILFHNNKYAFVLYSKSAHITTYYIDVLELTETGKQLFSLTDASLDLEYMGNALSKKIREYPNLSLFASEIIGTKNGQIIVSDKHLFDIN